MKTWWRHQMETFSALLVICAGNSPITGEFPAQSRWRGALGFSSICAWRNVWVNNREAGDLRPHRTHYDVIAVKKYATGCHNGMCLIAWRYLSLTLINVAVDNGRLGIIIWDARTQIIFATLYKFYCYPHIFELWLPRNDMSHRVNVNVLLQ